MTVFEAIQQRYSVRKYEDRPVEDDKLQRIMEAARLAPSARNRQEWRYVVVRDERRRELLMRAAKGQAFVGQAPVVIAGCARDDEYVMSCGQPATQIDVAISMEHIALQAVEEGLGTCWIGAFDAEAARQVIGAPEDVSVIELMTLGYPADEPRPKSRLPIDEIVMYEEWRE